MGRKSGSNRAFPTRTLEQALVVIQAIGDQGAARAMKRLLVADAIGRTPSSSEFKTLLSASRWYGLTTGTEKADVIAPTELGLKIIRPTSDVEKISALVAATLTPELMGRVLRDYNNSKLDPAFLRNTLQRTYDVDFDHSAELAELLVFNAKYSGILRSISGSNHVLIDNPLPSSTVGSEDEDDGSNNVVPMEDARQGLDKPNGPTAAPVESRSPRKIFIAHGKNRKPMEF